MGDATTHYIEATERMRQRAERAEAGLRVEQVRWAEAMELLSTTEAALAESREHAENLASALVMAEDECDRYKAALVAVTESARVALEREADHA